MHVDRAGNLLRLIVVKLAEFRFDLLAGLRRQALQPFSPIPFFEASTRSLCYSFGAVSFILARGFKIESTKLTSPSPC